MCRSLLRWVRASVALGAVWGAAWAVPFALVGVLQAASAVDSLDPGEEPLVMGVIGLLLGSAAGVSFVVLVALLEPRAAGMTATRGVAWGLVAGAVLPLVSAIPDGVLVVTSPLGALCALCTLALSRGAQSWPLRAFSQRTRGLFADADGAA
jgi:hypothetical protein